MEQGAVSDFEGRIVMTNDISAAQEVEVTLTIRQLEGIIRKVVREELMEFAAQEKEISYPDKESSLYEDMEDILERKESGQLKFHTHEEIWNG